MRSQNLLCSHALCYINVITNMAKLILTVLKCVQSDFSSFSFLFHLKYHHSKDVNLIQRLHQAKVIIEFILLF